MPQEDSVSRHVDAFHYRLEPLMTLPVDGEIMGYEILAGEHVCPNFDTRGWRMFYAYMVTEIPKIMDQYAGLIFINLNGDQMLDAGILESFALYPPDRLVIEWTEHSFQSDATLEILTQIARFKKAGFKIAVDDVGSGVDGMGRAIACKPHYAKIDGALLHHARKSDAETGHLYIAGMVQSLQSSGAQVLLEMVETLGDLQVALKTGADFGQGYLWTREAENA